ncbi:MAG: hypothetical protein ACYDAG_06765, partial [Chloroflexota bacterium]
PRPVRGATRALLAIRGTGRLRGRYQAVLRLGPSSVPLGAVTVRGPAPAAESSTPPPGAGRPLATFANGLDLLMADVSPGGLKLTWHPTAPIDRSLKVFVHVLDAGGRILAQDDGIPVGGLLPTTDWVPGSYLLDVYHLPNPLPPSARLIELGLYDPAGGKRLPVLAGGDRQANRYTIALARG